jgi:hypothetical protein
MNPDIEVDAGDARACASGVVDPDPVDTARAAGNGRRRASPARRSGGDDPAAARAFVPIRRPRNALGPFVPEAAP